MKEQPGCFAIVGLNFRFELKGLRLRGRVQGGCFFFFGGWPANLKTLTLALPVACQTKLTPFQTERRPRGGGAAVNDPRA